MSEAQKDGTLILIISVMLIPVWLLLSNGYFANAGPISNFFNSMYIWQMPLFCTESSDYSSFTQQSFTVQNCPFLYTKYFVLASLVAATYGYLVRSELAPNLLSLIRNAWRSRSNNHGRT